MNIDALAAEIGIDTRTLMVIVDLFVKQTAADLEDITTAVENNEREALIQSAHSIKGAALNLELAEIAEAAARLEHCARDEHTESMPSCVDALRSSFMDLKKELSGEKRFV